MAGSQPNILFIVAGDHASRASIGKWHLGEAAAHEPTGFDFWSVLPGQSAYFDPAMIEMGDDRNGR